MLCFPTPAPQVAGQDEKQGQDQGGHAHVPTLPSEVSAAGANEQMAPTKPAHKPKGEGKKGFVDRRRRKRGQAMLSSDEESEGSEGEGGGSSGDNLSLPSDSMEEDDEPDMLESLSETGTSGDEDEKERGGRGTKDEGTRKSENGGAGGSEEKSTRGSEEKSTKGSEEKSTKGSEEKSNRGSEDKGTEGADAKPEGGRIRGSKDGGTIGSEDKESKEPFAQKIENSPSLGSAEKPKRSVPRRPVSLAANFRTPVEDSKAVKADISSGHQASPMNSTAQASSAKSEEVGEDKTLGRLLQDARSQAAVNTACRLVAEDGYLLILKCFLDWLQSHPVVIATCAQVRCAVCEGGVRI